MRKKKKYNFKDLLKIMEKIRENCPWDKKQTNESILKYLKEETEEFTNEVNKKNYDGMKEELGDILWQVVFHSQIMKEKDIFTIDEVIDYLCKKMIKRHPHVFGNKKVKDEKEVIENWEKLKQKEKSH
ncbi:MAG TPA: MazG nucleotide pyrophosphohydrolase domain-containing protein [bacterium]|nr:MazG nucleotide pyrophosphohydrolase domain-containing protein [bacterium]HOM26130.1 MazG nucleotide pyrophosphohydrolase domain-containing protein [bacterium]